MSIEVKDLLLVFSALQAADQGFVIAKPDNSIVVVNRAMAEIFGYDQLEMKGMQLRDLIYPGQTKFHDQDMPLPEYGTVYEEQGIVFGVKKRGEKVRLYVRDRTAFRQGEEVFMYAVVVQIGEDNKPVYPGTQSPIVGAS